jgi:hypothetical protein
MGDVAGVDHKGGLGRHSLDLGDRVTQRAERIWVSGLVEADMTVADLDEGESRSFRGKGVAEEVVAEKAQGFRHAARQNPQHAGAGPDHAFECTPPANSCLFRLVSRGFSLKGSVFAHCGLLAVPGSW